MKKIFIVLLTTLLAGCASNVLSPGTASTLKSCNLNSKPWDIFPGHFYDTEIHLVPMAPAYDPNSTNNESAANSYGYSVVFVKKGSYYDSVGILNGDVISIIDGKDLKFADPTLLSEEDKKIFLKIKQGKKFSLQRCLKRE